MTKNLADMEIPVKFFNYKIFKGEKEFTLKNSYVYFISGPNNIGKTSFKDAFAIIQTGKNDIDEPVTKGESEGFIETTIPGADGRLYLIRHDFSDDKHNKFVAIDEDGKKISSVGDFRKIFQYTHFTAEEFFLWTNSADGRKKQKNIILNLLGTEDLMKYEILEQDELIEYDERTEKGHEKDQLIKLCQAGKLTDDQQELVNGLQETKNKLTKNQEKLTDISANDVAKKSLIQRQEDLKVFIYNQDLDITNMVNSYNNYLKEYNKEIEQIELRLKHLIEKRETLLKTFPEGKKKADELMVKYKTELATAGEELSKLPDANVDELLIIKKSLETKIEEVGLLQARVTNIKENQEKRDVAIKDYEGLTRKVDGIREQKKKLIASANLGVEGISIDDDHIKLDGFEFKENQVSKSQAIGIIARLMCAINKSPIQVIGSANDLDWEVLDQLDALARKQGKIMILDQVDRNATDIAVVGYEPKNLEPVTNVEKDATDKQKARIGDDMPQPGGIQFKPDPGSKPPFAKDISMPDQNIKPPNIQPLLPDVDPPGSGPEDEPEIPVL